MNDNRKEYLIQIAMHLMGIFFFLLIFDGALRKWFLPDYEKLIYILKDAIVLVALVLTLVSLRYRKWMVGPKTIWVSLGIYLVYVGLQVLNPRLPNLLVGVFGLKSHLLYMGLLVVIPALFYNLETIYRCLERYLSWIVIPLCLLAFAQAFSPQDSFVNIPVRGGVMATPMAGPYVRASGTFSYVTGFSWFLQLATLCSFFCIMFRQKIYVSNIIVLSALIAALPLNGSRAVVVISIVSLLMMVFVGYVAKLISSRKLLLILCLITVVGALLFLSPQNTWQGLVYRFLTSSRTIGDSWRYVSVFTNAFSFFDIAGWLGFGVGSAHQAAPHLAPNSLPFSWFPLEIVELNFEPESGRLVLELGIVGWIISLFMRSIAFASSIYIAIKGKTGDIRSAGVLAMPVLSLGLYVGNGVYAPPLGAAAYFFFLAIVLVAYRENAETGEINNGRA